MTRRATAADDKLGMGALRLQEGRSLLIAQNCPNLLARYALVVTGCDFPEVHYATSYGVMLLREDVAIYNSDPLHAEHIVCPFKAGKGVICTKLLVKRRDDAWPTPESARRTGHKLMVGRSSHFISSIVNQREAYEAGKIGEIELVEPHYLHRMGWYYQRSAWTLQGTDCRLLGLSRPVDLVRRYVGSIEEVHGYGMQPALAKRRGAKGFDVYCVNLRTRDRRIARIMRHYGLHELHLACNTVEVVLDSSEGTSMAAYPDLEYRYTRPAKAEVRNSFFQREHFFYFNWCIQGAHYGAFALYTDTFAQALLEARTYAPDLEEGVETVCVMEANPRWAQSGTPVPVALLLAEAGFVGGEGEML